VKNKEKPRIKPKPVQIQTTTVNQRRTSVHLTREGIIHLLNQSLQGVHVPLDADVHTMVPGGGDWSGMRLDFDDEHQALVISWEVRGNPITVSH